MPGAPAPPPLKPPGAYLQFATPGKAVRRCSSRILRPRCRASHPRGPRSQLPARYRCLRHSRPARYRRQRRTQSHRRGSRAAARSTSAHARCKRTRGSEPLWSRRRRVPVTALNAIVAPAITTQTTVRSSFMPMPGMPILPPARLLREPSAYTLPRQQHHTGRPTGIHGSASLGSGFFVGAAMSHRRVGDILLEPRSTIGVGTCEQPTLCGSSCRSGIHDRGCCGFRSLAG